MAENSVSKSGVSVDDLEDVSWDGLIKKTLKEAPKPAPKPDAKASAEDTDELDGKSQQDDDDPIQAAIDAALAAKEEELNQKAEARVRLALEGQLADVQREASEQQRTNALLSSFGDTVKEIRANVKQLRFFNAEGDETEIPDSILEEHIVKPLQRYNQYGVQAASAQVLTALGQAALDSLPEDAKAEFSKRARGKPVGEWLIHYAEALAPHTGWSKSKAAELEAAVKVAEARGFKRGKATPAGQPSGEESAGTGGTPKGSVDLKTQSGIARALHNGDIDTAKYLALRKEIETLTL